jgi:tetratricopeptide (TPR) repeat protein
MLPMFAVILSSALLACGPADPLVAIRKTQAQGRLEETIEPLRALIKERPGDAEVLFIYGRALSNLGKPGLAEWSLREAMKHPDWLVTAGLRLAADAARHGNYASAVEVSSKVLDVESENIDALLVRASAYSHSRMNHELALVDVERVLELDPDNLLVMEPLILSLIGLERIDELTEALEELGRKIEDSTPSSGSSAWLCATNAIFAWDGDDIELANSRWDQCLEQYPAEPEVVWKALPFYDSEMRYERSIEILRAAIEANQEARPYRVNLAVRLMNSDAGDEALEVLVAGTELESPKLASGSWRDLAKFYQEAEKYTDAAAAVGRAVEIVEEVATPQPTLLFEYADALLIAGQFDLAREVVERITHPPYREMIRARIAQEQRDFPLALEHFKAAFQLWPDNPWARYYAAQVSEALGDFDGAVEQYRHSIRISPAATDSRIHVARLHLAQNRPRPALQLLRVKVKEAPLSLEGELLSLEIWARNGQGFEIETSLGKIRRRIPQYIGQALARVAKGLNDSAGPMVAVNSLRHFGKIVPSDPNYSEALRALVEYSHRAGVADEVSGEFEAALAAHPEAAGLLEVVAFRLELKGASEHEIRTAYNTVLAAEPENVRALSGLGRLAAKHDNHELALSYFERATAAAPDDADLVVEASRALVALGRKSEAEERLNNLLSQVQFEGRAAALLAELHLGREWASDRTLDLAKRTVRFGGGVEGLELLARVHDARNEPELAKKASAEAKALLAKRAG